MAVQDTLWPVVRHGILTENGCRQNKAVQDTLWPVVRHGILTENGCRQNKAVQDTLWPVVRHGILTENGCTRYIVACRKAWDTDTKWLYKIHCGLL